MRRNLLSVGIDIGTSTTQLVFSRLTIENLNSGFSVPHLSIVKKEVVYKSGIALTPLSSPNEIDGAGVKKIIECEYQKAGVLPDEVSTGAVIITGETARKKNSNSVIEKLSRFAGDFVVTTAGPELESALSGRGAGADIISKELDTILANIDVGGGTSNISVFDKGRLAAVTCLDIGGRLIKIDRETGRITFIYGKIKRLAASAGISICEGEKADEEKFRRICRLMADILFSAVGAYEKSALFDEMFTGNCVPLVCSLPTCVSFSGGVSDCIYNNLNSDSFYYGDIGVMLGQEIKRHSALKKLKLCKSRETIRATVIGAGLHTTKISGSTIFYFHSKIPVKNAAIVRVPEEFLPNVAGFIREKLSMYMTDGVPQEVAIAFKAADCVSFEQIQRLAGQIIEGASSVIAGTKPLIIVVEQDIAKALGHAIDHKLHKTKGIICIDSIETLDGDYIDIGEPIADGSAVPVVVKTLIFNT